MQWHLRGLRHLADQMGTRSKSGGTSFDLSEKEVQKMANPDIRRTDERAQRQTEAPGGQPVPPLLPNKHSNVDPATETPVEGRQGFLGRPVLAVLVGGLLLAGIAWIVVHYAVR